MANFSASDAAFAGFAFVRRQPGTVLIWAIAQVVMSVGLFVLVVGPFTPTLVHLAAVQRQGPDMDPKQAMDSLRLIAPFYGDVFLYVLVLYPILFATINRAVLRPKESAFGYIRLGGDELRQLGLVLSYVVLGFGAWVVIVIVTAILAVVVGLLTHAASHNDGLTLLGVVAVYLASIAACIVFGVRLSLASAQTFATRKLDIFGSWALTKGRFWSMFGAYLLAGILGLIVTLLGYVIIAALMVASGGGDELLSAFRHPAANPMTAMSAGGALLTAPRIIQLVLGGILSAFTLPVTMMPAPTIYREIAGDAAASSDVS